LSLTLNTDRLRTQTTTPVTTPGLTELKYINVKPMGRDRAAGSGLLPWAWIVVGLMWTASPFAASPVEVADFSLHSTSGQTFRLSEQRGDIVLMGFWARWCGDCREAMQAMNEIADKYQRAGVVTVGVNVGDTTDQALAMSHTLGLRFTNLVDADKAVGDQFQLNKMPLIVLIDRDGVLRYRHAGYTRGDDTLIAEQLRRLINE